MLRFDEKLLSRSNTASSVEVNKSDFQLSFDCNENDEHIDMLTEVGETSVDDASDVTPIDRVEQRPDSGERKGWRRVREYYNRSKQYIFVAATLPENGKRTAGGVLKRIFPEANWVSGNYLHRHNPR